LDKDALTEEQAKALHESFGAQVSLEPPSFLTDGAWRLTSQGWVGYIPLDDALHFALASKVPISSLFGMLEYAYNLDFRTLDGLTTAESIPELYKRLAALLANRILYRIKRGVYRSYVNEQDRLPYVRGRVDFLAHLRNPALVKLPCVFEDHTSDLEDNQILLWTLTRILESGICTSRSLNSVRQARRALMGLSSHLPFGADSCVGRTYNRLNNDYESMHALCRFFLDHAGPMLHQGDRQMIPILINMERLFESFVVEWMKEHLPKEHPQYAVRGQERIQFNMGQQVSIRIDITVKDITTGRTCCVLDTKYKAPDSPSTGDMEQVVAYAEATNSPRAVLIYPVELASPVEGQWGDVRVQSLAFRLDGNLDSAGAEMLRRLFAST